MSNSATPWTVAHQAPLSMGFTRQEHWSDLPCPPGDLPNPGIKPGSPALQAESFHPSHQEALFHHLAAPKLQLVINHWGSSLSNCAECPLIWLCPPHRRECQLPCCLLVLTLACFNLTLPHTVTNCVIPFLSFALLPFYSTVFPSTESTHV